MASYIDREMPSKTLKLWRTQSPRHFHGGEWDRNGSCVTDRLLEEDDEVPHHSCILNAKPFRFRPCIFIRVLMNWCADSLVYMMNE